MNFAQWKRVYFYNVDIKIPFLSDLISMSGV